MTIWNKGNPIFEGKNKALKTFSDGARLGACVGAIYDLRGAFEVSDAWLDGVFHVFAPQYGPEETLEKVKVWGINLARLECILWRRCAAVWLGVKSPVYIACPYAYRPHAQRVAKTIRKYGVTVSSTWHDREPDSVSDPQVNWAIALSEIRDAKSFLCLAFDGGRSTWAKVEYASSWAMPVTVIYRSPGELPVSAYAGHVHRVLWDRRINGLIEGNE